MLHKCSAIEHRFPLQSAQNRCLGGNKSAINISYIITTTVYDEMKLTSQVYHET
jgi:hypothetical protein